ncbi:hypothetical protein ACNQUF_12015, partial [Corynebacterium diphtheriae]
MASSSARGVLGQQGLQLAVEGGGFELGEGLVELVVVLLREELPEPVGDAGAYPHVDGFDAEQLDRRERRAPQIRCPSRVTVIGCSSPWRRIDSTSGIRSPWSCLCRAPTTIESAARSSSIRPSSGVLIARR